MLTLSGSSCVPWEIENIGFENMGAFGWFLFVVGGIMALLFGVVGLEGVANMAGTQVGCALIISGAVFAGLHKVQKAQLVSIDVRGRTFELKLVGNGTFLGSDDKVLFSSIDEAVAHYTESLKKQYDR